MKPSIMLLFVLITFCTKQVTTIIEPIEQPQEKAIMKFKPEDPKPDEQPPTVPMKVNKQIVTVYFQFDSYKLMDSEKWKISNIEKPVYLVGGACPIGDNSYNYILGMYRAVAVRDYLEGKGVNVASYRSVGENNLVSEKKGEYHLNRRCEITY